MRSPAVSGLFYPSDRRELENMLNTFNHNSSKILSGNMAVVPHAGYVYSGITAMFSYKNLNIKDRVVIVGPNHYGFGPGIALSSEDWITPLGIVKTDNEIYTNLNIPVDERAHEKEHSIEVQLPFLQYLKGDFSFIPISFKDQNIENAYFLAEQVSNIDATFIFSSDFSHYVPESIAKQEDYLAIELIKEKNPEEFYEEFVKRDWSICGFGGILTFMIIAKNKNFKVDFINYSTSADFNGDRESAVGYASIVAH